MIAVIVNIEAPVAVAPSDHAPIACRRAIERVYLGMVFAAAAHPPYGFRNANEFSAWVAPFSKDRQ
jgi:hypothetical protein